MEQKLLMMVRVMQFMVGHPTLAQGRQQDSQILIAVMVNLLFILQLLVQAIHYQLIIQEAVEILLYGKVHLLMLHALTKQVEAFLTVEHKQVVLILPRHSMQKVQFRHLKQAMYQLFLKVKTAPSRSQQKLILPQLQEYLPQNQGFY